MLKSEINELSNLTTDNPELVEVAKELELIKDDLQVFADLLVESQSNQQQLKQSRENISMTSNEISQIIKEFIHNHEGKIESIFEVGIGDGQNLELEFLQLKKYGGNQSRFHRSLGRLV